MLQLATILSAGCSGSGQAASEDQVEAQELQIIYGADDRLDVHAVGSDLRELALGSTLALLSEGMLRRRSDGAFEIVAPSLGEQRRLCDSENFGDQPAAATCSGVLIDEALVLTAGHCAGRAAPCEEQLWAFDYALQSPGAWPVLEEASLYRCRAIPLTVRETEASGVRNDYGFVELDRPVSRARRPAPLSSQPPRAGDPARVIGYPTGLPAKVDSNAQLLNTRASTHDYFTMTADTFEGSSGSGVFNEVGELIGVAVRGGADFEHRDSENCFAARFVEGRSDPDASEQASYADAAVSALCVSGYENARLCPFAQRAHEYYEGCALRAPRPGASGSGKELLLLTSWFALWLRTLETKRLSGRA